MDILRAHKMLEQTTFKQKYGSVLASYYVRNVMGTLLWKMAYDLNNMDTNNVIMEEGKREYPELKKYIVKNNIGSVLFGRLLYANIILELL